MKKHLWSTLFVLPVLALAAAASPDASFYHDAAQAGIAEVRLGELAHG